MFVPALSVVLALSPFFAAIAWLALILFGLLFVFQSVNATWSWWRNSRAGEKAGELPPQPQKAKRFHITVIDSQCWWGQSKQPDGNMGLQLYAIFIIKNLTDQPLNLLKARVVEPKIEGFVIMDTMISEGSLIPPGISNRVPVHILIIRKEPYAGGHFDALIAVQDDEGNEETAKVTLRDQKEPIV